MGLGYGRGFGVADKGSILDSGDPVLFLISNRVLAISRFLIDAEIITEEMLASHLLVSESQTQVDEREELLYGINNALNPYYVDAFDNLFDASEALLKQFQDYEDEEEDEEAEGEHPVAPGDEEEEDFESLSELDKELLLAEREEEEDEDKDDEDDEITL